MPVFSGEDFESFRAIGGVGDILGVSRVPRNLEKLDEIGYTKGIGKAREARRTSQN